MFGHLNSEDFVNLMEHPGLYAQSRRHLGSCRRCSAIWESVSATHAEITSVQEDIPEPDWRAFRSSIRDQLLARSVQREAFLRRWTGWSVRPSVVWALSLILAFGIPTGAWFLHLQKDRNAEYTNREAPKAVSAAELIEAGTEKTVFDDLMELNDSEQENLHHLLQSRQRGPARVQ